MKAQLDAETKTDETLQKLVGKYYKTSMENAKIARASSPRWSTRAARPHFILHRTDSVMEMGYIKKKPGRDAIDWTLLEAGHRQESGSLWQAQVQVGCLSRRRAAAVSGGVRRRDIPPGGGSASVRRVAGTDWLSRSGGRCLSIGLFAGIWELCWALGWADPKLLPPPHIFLGNIVEQAQVLQHGEALADRRRRLRPAACEAVMITCGATTMRVLRRAW